MVSTKSEKGLYSDVTFKVVVKSFVYKEGISVFIDNHQFHMETTFYTCNGDIGLIAGKSR